MSGWKVEVIPVAEREIKKLPVDLQARFLHVAEMLENLGPRRIGEPHVRYLGKKLWEMRMRGRDGIARAIYFAATGKRLIVVRAFVKKSQKTPRREIETATSRIRDL